MVALLAAACDPAAVPARQDRATAPRVVAPKRDASTSPAASARIDPPVGTARSQIVDRADIQVSGEPACAFTIRYRGAVDQPVTWNKEPCAAITARFIPLATLRELGKGERLSPEALADLERTPGKSVFYIESTFTASIYPLNSAGRVYEVPVAD